MGMAAQSTYLLHVDGLHELLASIVLHVELKDSVGLHGSVSLYALAERTHLLLEVLLFLVRHRRDAVGDLLEVLVRLELAHFAVVVGRKQDLPRVASILAQHSVPVKVCGPGLVIGELTIQSYFDNPPQLLQNLPILRYLPVSGPDRVWLMRGNAKTGKAGAAASWGVQQARLRAILERKGRIPKEDYKSKRMFCGAS